MYNMYNWRKYYRITNWTDCSVPRMTIKCALPRRRPTTPDTDTRRKSLLCVPRTPAVTRALLYNSVPFVGR